MKISDDGNNKNISQMPQIDWFCFDEKGKPVCNFIPEVSTIIDVKSSDNKIVKSLINLNLQFQDGNNKECILPLSEIDRIDWFKIDQRCIVNPKYRKAKEYIGNIIRIGLNKAPTVTKYSLNKLGIECINDSIFFVVGDWVITRSSDNKPIPDFELEPLPFRLDIDPDITSKTAFEGIRKLVGLNAEIGNVLLAHTISGITRAAFKEAGITPNTVLMVVGKSNMLKSHYVPYIVQLYNRSNEIKAVTRFNSTTRFIEDILYEYSECTAVIDDLHTAASKSIKRTNETAAEEIIRRISDDTGRGRKEGNLLVQKKFRGNAVFIGEYSVGKESSIPRFLILNIRKRPDGSVLDKYQRHQPLLVSTFYYFFIQWYVDHFNEIRNEIDESLTEFRKKDMDSEIHGRLRDTFFYLKTSYMFFLKFCEESGFITNEDAKEDYIYFNSLLTKLIQEQQAKFMPEKRKSETVDYLKLIRKLYKSDSFHLTANINEFNPKKHDGIIHYNCLCLRGENLDKKISKIFPGFNHNELIDTLIANNALKRVKEKNTVQIKGLRFYGIYLHKL